MPNDQDTTFPINYSAWRRHTRNLTPLARVLYFEILGKLIQCGPHGTFAGADTEGGLEFMSSLTGINRNLVQKLWSEIKDRFCVDGEGAYFCQRARDLAWQSLAIRQMENSITNSGRKLQVVTKKRKRDYNAVDYNIDPNFQRFWKATPQEMKVEKKVAFGIWADLVVPMGQDFIEVVLAKWAAYCASPNVRRRGSYMAPAQWLKAQCWKMDYLELEG